MNAREIANIIHEVSYEVEKEEPGYYSYRDFISFEGMPEDYQNILIKVVAKLRERGVINER